jgi:hypothetical protein
MEVVMRLSRGPLFLLGLLLVVGPVFAADKEREAVPSPEAQDKALKLIKDLFKLDYAKTRATDRLALSVKLLQQATDTKDDSAARYTLLQEASRLAARAGSLEQALKAVQEITTSFATSGAALKAEVCEAVAPYHIAKAPSEYLAEVALAASADALDADEFDIATRLVKVAQPAALRSKTVVLVRAVETRAKDIEQMKSEAEKIKPALETLEKKPDDADANLAVGKYRSFLKGQWDKGLPNLAKGGDATLKGLAEKDLAGSADAAGQAEIGDAWYDLAGSQEGVAKLHLQKRAVFWYQQAAPTLTGLNKTRVDKRLAELEKVAGPATGTTPKNDWFVLLRSSDPRAWNQDLNRGKDLYAVSLKKAPEKIEYLKLTYPAKNDYVIVPVTKDNLASVSDDGRYGWNGTNKFEYKGFHLGVFDSLGDATKKRGSVCVLVPGAGQGYLGWGFGHIGGGNERPGWTWAGENLAPSVFEVSVKAGPLTDAESRKLLKK